MKDLSLFLLKNSLGAKMKKGITTFCNGDDSTSTLNQQQQQHNYLNINGRQTPPTLEEMILQLELEEESARKEKLIHKAGTHMRGRMSCVNNSDILRSARNALNQYPRFSLDGKDAMYRSSFSNIAQNNKQDARKSFCCGHGGILEKTLCLPVLPPTLAGESVMWCKPGVVAKLMGLDAMPVPLTSRVDSKEKLNSVIIKRQNLRRRAERHEMERRVAAMEMDINMKRSGRNDSCSRPTGGYCTVVKPVAVQPPSVPAGWPTRRFL